jgi:hypothetical protein
MAYCCIVTELLGVGRIFISSLIFLLTWVNVDFLLWLVFLLEHFKHKVNINYIYIFSSNFIENALYLHYNEQFFNLTSVNINNHCFIENNAKHTNAVCGQNAILISWTFPQLMGIVPSVLNGSKFQQLFTVTEMLSPNISETNAGIPTTFQPKKHD